MFLLAIGNMLITASQVVVVTYTLGAAAAAVWSFTTKTFTMANQFIGRIYNYSSPAFAEMVVRGEQERLRTRFRDVVTLSASAGVFLTLSVALCNQSFLQIWTGSDRMSWSIKNDLLMAFYIFTFTTTRCHVGLVCVSKDLRAMKFVYLVEGIAFIALAAMLGHWLGFSGIILGGIITNLAFSGFYGMQRSAVILGLPLKQIVCDWLYRPALFLFVMFLIVSSLKYATSSLPAISQLIVSGMGAAIFGGVSLWKFGLPKNLQTEFTGAIIKLRGRFFKPA
jgi:O-antigen/teichoic acid export membrane protein